MECLQIDWKNTDDTFEIDEFYESIQAPRWIDFTAPLQPVDDHEWFCGRAGCTHVKKTSWQTEDSILPDSQTSQIAKEVAPSTASAASGKRARGVVSSSYSSLSDIKEAFAKHKVLHLAKMPCVAESNAQATKNSAHASENQNPNQTCKAQIGISKIPILKASEGLAKKIKVTESKYVTGKQPTREVLAGVSELPCSTFSKQLNQSQTRVVLDVSKSTSLLGIKDGVQKKSTLNRTVVKEQDIKVLTDGCRASEPENKKEEAARAPFSVYVSRFAMVPSLAMPSKRPTMPARSLQNDQLGNERSASCRPPRIVARKAEAINVQTYLMRNDCRDPVDDTQLCGNMCKMEGKVIHVKHRIPMLNKRNLKDNASLAYTACMQDQQIHASTNDNEERVSTQPMGQEQCSSMQVRPVISLASNGENQASHAGKENQKEVEARHTLEEHLENLYLSTPNSKHCEVKVEMGQFYQSNKVSKLEIGQPHCIGSIVDLEMVSSQHEDDVLACEMEVSHHLESAAEHIKPLSHHVDVGQSLNCPSQSPSSCEMNRSLESQTASDVNYSASQIGGSILSMHTARELLAHNANSERNPKQLQPVKDWRRSRGLKRKSSELNFKVNCSSKDHVHENEKTMQSSLTSAFVKAPPSGGFIDSCKEQHKKIKTTKAQPFKPFRLRTEERGALRELGLGRKEQVAPSPPDLVHHALRMPSFGHPFRPQRSTKKLTVPKEPSFHLSRMRKTGAGPPTWLGS